MKIGTFLTLEASKNTGDKYRCKIIEKKKNLLIIDYPVQIQSKKTTFFPKGTRFIASYVGDDNSVYRFPTVVKGKQKLNVPAISLEKPEKERIERIQRRQYVRVDAAVDLAIHSVDQSFPSFTTVTADISGGGLSFILPKGQAMNENDKVNAWLVLPMNNGEYKYTSVEGEVIRVITNKNKADIASLKFISISQETQQFIIKYCFEIQRELRKKELY
ncbi:c-di-GMP-binding flagellar brake protein YcgR, contains PilZNR and PilZ domains [Oceanobacillus limi]|uniref:C-di-GMP-binding flagellar brake protein YcgR, contains PilZNR and PilZ domains n=1 Tax=Oceanobacillus limi TaxID=930131 RepID=A0A1H9ZH18_9BACI|nr:flagellar brake domain-containing protein [Oceanobacillus limi]SES80964.1 c-di-GMP-binding flagellar brake protein YcgR, contains PilZNR and PilZ domains [Oceanobacillus limi]